MSFLSWLFGDTPGSNKTKNLETRKAVFDSNLVGAKEYLSRYYEDPLKPKEEPKEELTKPKAESQKPKGNPNSGYTIQFQHWEAPVSYSERDNYDEDRLSDIIGKNHGALLDNYVNLGFSMSMLSIMMQKDLSAPDVYKAAGIDRKLYSKISNDKNYKPSKDTCIAICIALKLTLSETNTMLNRAGYSLSHSIKRDVVIEYCIKNKIWPVSEVDEILYALNLDMVNKMSSY